MSGRPGPYRVVRVEWRCALCPASGSGLNDWDAFWRYETHYARVHKEKSEQ